MSTFEDHHYITTPKDSSAQLKIDDSTSLIRRGQVDPPIRIFLFSSVAVYLRFQTSSLSFSSFVRVFAD
ncbi:hypothetical protein CEP54_000018 [Fusarium duplospermum]|uniref:Uncharacterized protein n=1 Tax=Fusarium duplospermum TaxID=1325734 RepID=A0A428R809_9HYPO|nr:hypothetical protein CEP54_000018 [Fusarium duplospermum]